MIHRTCHKCKNLIRVDDIYERFCRTGSAVRRCEKCGSNNYVYLGMDGKIELTKKLGNG